MRVPAIKSKGLFLLAGIVFLLAEAGHTQQQPTSVKHHILTLDEFLERATKNDTEFEEILITELTLQYQKALKLPAKDLILSVKQQHEFFFDQNRDDKDTTVSLSKLFPYIGTEIEADYQVGASIGSAVRSSSASVGLSQPVAQNAFGRSTRMLDKIVGLEVEVARHQVVEAYEDYLAMILTSYYSWYEDYENLKVGESSYNENVKLLDNILERERQKIALPIDVNKVRLQVMSKEESLIELQEQFKNSLNTIERIIRFEEGETPLIPSVPGAMGEIAADFKPAFEEFQEQSRTFDILQKLEDKSSLEVSRDADALLPSINLITGYQLSGEEYEIKNENNFFYAGIEIEWPIGHQVERAEYEISKIRDKQTTLSTLNTYHRLYTQLLNLHLQIGREQKLIRIAQERIELAGSILDDEAENYSFGKVTLNDYIQAVNALDNNRFNKIRHEALKAKLIVEWLRLTDRLIHKSDIKR